MNLAVLSLLAMTAFVLPTGPQQTGRRPFVAEIRDTVFTVTDGRKFDARIVLPPVPGRNGFGVLMIGGGIGNDLDWSLPGSMEIDGRRVPFTIEGTSHADAPQVANSLARRGFVVMHWSTIHRDDPKRDAWPQEMTPVRPQEVYEFTQAALAHFRSLRLFPPHRVILLGHSLGAVRAANIAHSDDGIAALVMLAPAQFARTAAADRGRNENRSDATRILGQMDRDGDTKGDPAEFGAWQEQRGEEDLSLREQDFETLDFHADGLLVDWEISAGLARDRRPRKPSDRKDRFGMRWTEDILAETKIPTLVVYGSLDSAQAHHAPIIHDLIRDGKLPSVEQRVVGGLGHQLGPEKDGRPGPIDRQACEMVADWLQQQIQPADGQSP